MTRQAYAAVWLTLALATLALLLLGHAGPIGYTTTALAWLGGIVTERLRQSGARIR